MKTLYIKNLPENVAKEKLKEMFEKHGEVTKVVLPPGKPGQKRDFGFVHFAERSSALKACKGSEKYEVDGNLLSHPSLILGCFELKATHVSIIKTETISDFNVID